MLNKLLHGIKVYKDLFSEEESVKLFKDMTPYLRPYSKDHPGLQTHPDLHKQVNIPHIKYFTYEKCWMNFTDIGFPDHEVWHTHDYKRAGVYYFDDCPGTVFKGKLGKFQVEGVANSVITFPSNLLHTAPLNQSGRRFTVAFNIVEEWQSGLLHQS